METIYNPSDAFITGDTIKLKDYPDDLLVYFSGENTNLELNKCPGIATPYVRTSEEDVRVYHDETEGPYTHVGEGQTLSYYKNNFKNFKSGCLRFTAKKEDSKDDYSYQELIGFMGVGEAGDYSITITTFNNGTELDTDINFTIDRPLDITEVAGLSNIINTAIENKFAVKPFYTLPTERGLLFRTAIDEGTATNGYLKIAETGNEDSLDVWFVKKLQPSYFCAPEEDTEIISLHEAEGINNKIAIIHKTDGYLYLFMADETGTFTIDKRLCKWDWSNETFTEFELNFDSSLTNFIVNGKVKAFFETVGTNSAGTEFDSIVRAERQETYLTFVNGGDAYGFGEVDAFDKKQHCGSYDAPDSVVSYDGNAYVEYQLGDISVYDDSTLTITGNGNMLLEAYDGSLPLTTKDGDVVKADNIDDFIALFKEVDYDPNSTLSFEAGNLTFKITYLDKDAEITGFNFNPGKSVYDYNDPYNFEDLYAWVRRQCGAPQVKCELTDEQIYDALCKAVEKYNKYRNWNENLNIADIDGTEETDLKKVIGTKAEGTYYQLPANIADNDIIDIFFQPRFSVCWFGAGDNFLNNVMAQTFFGLYGGIVQNSADYYIHRISCNDISNIIGTQVSWRIYDHHLYFTPNNLGDLEQFTVGIKYRPSLTVEEIRSNENIKALTLGYAMKTLGIIRGSFGGSIQAGDIAIQLNADTLLAEGDKLVNDTIALLKSEQKPLWIMWT